MSPTRLRNIRGAIRSFRIVSWLLRVGMIVCVLAIIPSQATGICLCNAPKELVLELIGLGSIALLVLYCSRIRVDSVDLFLALFLIFSIISGGFAAPDRWEALRAVGISVAGVAIFWSSRVIAKSGRRRELLDVAALAVVLVASTVVLDALGFNFGLSVTRPAGTLGDRNSAAHFLALGMPLLLLQSFKTESAWRQRLALSSLVIVGAALLLTRSRAAWLAVLSGTLLIAILLGLTPRRFHPSLTGTRVMHAMTALVAGLILGLCIPTQLHWKAAHPYLESFENLAESNSGSGRVRLNQYHDSLLMLIGHETLGVGPGNWKILYKARASDLTKHNPENAAPTYGGTAERTIWYLPNRLNSDWIAFAVERGLPAVTFLLAALATFAIWSGTSWSRLHIAAPGSDPTPRLVVLLTLVVVIVIVGSFDAVLQLPAPTYLAFLTLGALAPTRKPLFSISLSHATRLLGAATTILLAGVLAIFTFNEIYVSYLIARPGPNNLGAAYRISLDKRWFLTEVVWSERAVRKDSGRYPACD
jgi:putative inorganic carbon (hco3(-)) transporter